VTRTILVLEDEHIVAMDIAEELRDGGWTVVGPAGSVAMANKLIEAGSPQVALLDVNLNGSDSFGLAERLIEEGVRVIFLTGYSASSIPERFSGCPVIAKPVDLPYLNSVLRAE
jgi:DNA-binding response OmpR family regulator